MRRAACFTMITLYGIAAFGQGLLDCIEPDVLRTLLLQSQGERPPVITAAVPAEIAALRLPAQFTWIGSAERITGRMDATTNASQVTAAWRSRLAPDAARAAATTALAASGWEILQQLAGLRVFGTAAAQFPQRLCRDGKTVSVNASAMEGVTYLLLTIPRGNGDGACSQSARPAALSNSGFEPYLPQLELPADPASGAVAPFGSGGSSSSTSLFSARVEFTIRDSAANVARHFAKQMAEQGWSSDANWSGTSTAGSSWSRRGEGGARILGTLSVTAFDERQFMAELRVTRLQ